MKDTIFAALKEDCINRGWTEASMIPDTVANNVFVQLGYTVTSEGCYLNVGKDGFMYVSYEDVNIYKTLIGVEKASNTVDYNKIYQYDELGAPLILPLTVSRMYVASIFDRNESDTEYLTEVSMSFAQASTCEVYVNPNGNSKEPKDLIKVELKDGTSENVAAGYHTLELKEPLKLTSDKFVVALKLEGKETTYSLPIEAKVEGTPWSEVKLEKDKSFWTFAAKYIFACLQIDCRE